MLEVQEYLHTTAFKKENAHSELSMQDLGKLLQLTITLKCMEWIVRTLKFLSWCMNIATTRPRKTVNNMES